MKCSIIIPNWNGRRFLKTCLGSLAAQSHKPFEIILVDNGSTDATIDFVKKRFPRVKIIALAKNVGFAAAVNAGIKKASGDYVALLNNDTEADKNWLKNMLDAARRQPEAMFFASKMLDYYKRDTIDSCGDAMTWCGRSYKIGEGEKDGPRYQKEKFIFGACAGAALYRKEFFAEVGYFDEDFFAYLEDVDIDFRAQFLGLKCLFASDARVYHIGSATAGRKSRFAFGLMIRNHFFVILKDYPLSLLIANLPKIIYSEFRFFLASIREGFVGKYFQSILGIILQTRTMLKKRGFIQRHRTVSNQELNKNIDNNFNYKPLFQALKNYRG